MALGFKEFLAKKKFCRNICFEFTLSPHYNGPSRPTFDMMMEVDSIVSYEDSDVETSLCYKMQQCVFTDTPHVFKIPILPPWRIRRKPKKITNNTIKKVMSFYHTPDKIMKKRIFFKKRKCYWSEKKKPEENKKVKSVGEKKKSVKFKEISNLILHAKAHLDNIHVENMELTESSVEFYVHVRKYELLVDYFRHGLLFESEQHLKPVYINIIDPCTTEEAYVFQKKKTERLLLCLMKYLKCKKISELKNKKISDAIWKKVSKKLTIPFYHTKKYWYHKLHMQLFCSQPIIMKNIIINFICSLYKVKCHPYKWIITGVKDWDGFTIEFLCKIHEILLNYADRSVKCHKNYTTSINYLYKYHLSIVNNMKIKWTLPRLDYSLKRIDPLPIKKYETANTYSAITSFVEPDL